jgi:hypothetical protein
MSNTWKEIDAEQKREAPPSTCRYCGEPIYWEALPGGKKRPVNATDLEAHYCNECLKKEARRGEVDNPERQLVTDATGGDSPVPASEEEKMPTNKGHCPHGEFILTEGCPQCIEEHRNKQQQLDLDPAPELIGTQLAEEAGITEVEEEDASYRAPYNASYHAPYRLQDGSIVPGVTTILKELSQGEGMQYWAWDLGRQGLDYKEVRDAAGRVGTLAHHLIACHLNCQKPSASVFSPAEVDKAGICFRKYLAWEKENPLTPVMIEEPLASETFKYGGTPDLLAEINGEFILLDFKTGGGIYDSYFCQLAAYRKLLEEQSWPVAGARIIRISPDENDRIEVAIAPDYDRDWQIFQHALGICTLRGEKQ